ncbi:hypothetical protein Hypma_007738 [Hypsizygus marmoreus]|uniref:Uncharacterized protein n=1 Tax=Hypsizygus marmoreus TaxID=39966 RepID=A0A369JWK8_HYPMA|nr:hypothetical protein Hypma_007738 [Hypsizygus marmoreus]
MFKSSQQPSSTAKDPPLSPPPSSPATTAPPTTPRKRGFQPSSDLSSPELTPSQKRTKLIKEALSGTSTPPQTPSRMRQPEASPSRSQRSQRRLEDIQLGLSSRRSRSPVRINTQHDTLNPSQSGDSSRSLTLSQPSNYKTSLQTVNTNYKAPDDDDDDDDAALWAQVTPPPSDSAELGPLSDEHGRNAGTVLFASEKGRLHWQHDDPDNLFDETQSQVTNSTSRSHPYCVPSTELSTELSADTISTLLDRMDGIPDYVRKLERKKIAAEKSNEAKAKRIAELEKEVERSVVPS